MGSLNQVIEVKGAGDGEGGVLRESILSEHAELSISANLGAHLGDIGRLDAAAKGDGGVLHFGERELASGTHFDILEVLDVESSVDSSVVVAGGSGENALLVAVSSSHFGGAELLLVARSLAANHDVSFLRIILSKE